MILTTKQTTKERKTMMTMKELHRGLDLLCSGFTMEMLLDLNPEQLTQLENLTAEEIKHRKEFHSNLSKMLRDFRTNSK
jgi:hypothetical protein